MGSRDFRPPAGGAKRRVAGRNDARSTSPGSESDGGDNGSRVAANQRDVDLGRLIDATTINSVAAAVPPAPVPPPTARGLPMALLSTPEPGGSTLYVVTALDKWGRMADATPTRAMNWRPGTKISYTADLTAGFIVIRPGGPEHVTTQGHLRLPLHLRYRLALGAGDRLLLAIMPHLAMVTAYPMSTVDVMVRAHHTTAARSEEAT